MNQMELREFNSRPMETTVIIFCKGCAYFKPFKDAQGYGECQSNHTFDGAFRETDYCSYAKEKTRESNS